MREPTSQGTRAGGGGPGRADGAEADAVGVGGEERKDGEQQVRRQRGPPRAAPAAAARHGTLLRQRRKWRQVLAPFPSRERLFPPTCLSAMDVRLLWPLDSFLTLWMVRPLKLQSL